MKPLPNITLQTIAEASGVARSTVSKALRNDPTIPAHTRERITLKAKELGYKPSPGISALMSQLRLRRLRKSSEPIAFVTAFPSAGQWKKILSFRAYFEGASERCQQLGFRLEEFWVGSVEWRDKRLSQILRARGIRGLMLAPAPSTVTRLDIDWRHFCVIAFGYGFKDIPCHRVSNNQYRTMLRMLSRLDHLGYRRIGLLYPRSFDQNITNNIYAATSVYQSYLPQHLRIPPLMEEKPDCEQVLQWVREHQIDVIITGLHETPEWLRRGGLKTPRDIGLAFFSGLDVHLHNMTGVNQNGHRIGTTAAELMAEQLYSNNTGFPPFQKFVLVEGDWCHGKTVRNHKTGPLLDWNYLF